MQLTLPYHLRIIGKSWEVVCFHFTLRQPELHCECVSNHRVSRGSYIWSIWREHRHHFTVLLYNPFCGWTCAGWARHTPIHVRASDCAGLINQTILCRAIGAVRLQRATPSLQRRSLILPLAVHKTSSTSSVTQPLGWGRHLFILYWQKDPVLHSRETPYRQGWATFQGGNLPTAVSTLWRSKKRKLSVGFNTNLSNIKMSISLIDSVSADQQNALKVVRASKPRVRKSSKVMFFYIFFFKASKVTLMQQVSKDGWQQTGLVILFSCLLSQMMNKKFFFQPVAIISMALFTVKSHFNTEASVRYWHAGWENYICYSPWFV